MKIKKVNRYYSDCGRGFWSKKACLKHEENCKCWTNPAFRTCKTCIFAREYNDSNGMEHEPQFLQTWRGIECTNPNFDHDTDFNQAHEKAPYLCVNCTKWKFKKGEWDGEFKKWELAPKEELEPIVLDRGMPF